MNDLLKQKTTWAGVAGIVTALSGYFTGSMDAQAALELGFTSLIAIFLRQSVAKINK